MVTNFEEITNDLTQEELKVVELLLKGFAGRKKENPIKGPEAVESINKFIVDKPEYNGYRFTEPRLRKCCNYIRVKSLLPLVATAKGYYVSYDKEEIKSQIQSLEDRANSILSSANGLKKFL